MRYDTYQYHFVGVHWAIPLGWYTFAWRVAVLAAKWQLELGRVWILGLLWSIWITRGKRCRGWKLMRLFFYVFLRWVGHWSLLQLQYMTCRYLWRESATERSGLDFAQSDLMQLAKISECQRHCKICRRLEFCAMRCHIMVWCRPRIRHRCDLGDQNHTGGKQSKVSFPVILATGVLTPPSCRYLWTITNHELLKHI